MIALELLKQQRLLANLPADQLEKLRHHVHLKEFAKREMVLREGQRGDALLMLFTGQLQIMTLSDQGKEVGINYIMPGEHFGEISLIDGLPRSASVVALTNAVVGFLPKAQALWLFYNSPSVAEQIQKKLCATIRQEIKHRSQFNGSKAFNRIYAVISKTQAGVGRTTQDQSSTIEQMPTQQTIASMANVSRETVSRAIQALIKAGIIQKDTRQLIIKDPRALEQLAKGEVQVDQLMPSPESPRLTRLPDEADRSRGLSGGQTTIVIRRSAAVHNTE